MSSNISNSTLNTSLHSLSLQMPPYILYVVFGSIAIVCNSIVILVFSIDKTLRFRYQMFIGLAIADLFNSIATVGAGIDRINIINTALSTRIIPKLTAWMCCQNPWPAMLSIGTQWPAAVTAIIAVERCIAVYFPFWYRLKMSPKKRMYGLGLSVAIVVANLVGAYLNVYIRFPNQPLQQPICTIPGTFTLAYQWFDCLFVIFGHTFGLILMIAAYRGASKRLSSSLSSDISNYYQQERLRIRLYVSVTAFEVLLIGIPQLLLFNPNNLFFLFSLQGPYCYALFCASSFVNTLIYLTTNRDFRTKFLIYASCGLYQSKSVVVSIAPTGSNQRTK